MSVGITQYTSWEDPSMTEDIEDHARYYGRIACDLVNEVRAQYGDNKSGFFVAEGGYLVIMWGRSDQGWVGKFDTELPYTILEAWNDFLIWRGSEWRLRADFSDDPFRIDLRLYPGGGATMGRELA